MSNKKKVTLGLLAAALIIALILSLVSCGGARGGTQQPAAAPLKVSFSDFKLVNRGRK